MPPPPTRGGGALRGSNNKISVFVLMLNKAKPQESGECYWFFNKCRKQHQSGYQINRDKVNHACIHNKHVWFFPCFHWRHLLSAGLGQSLNRPPAWHFYASVKSWLLTERNLGFSIAVLAHWKKNCKNVAAFIITTNKQSIQQENLIPVS